MIDSACNGRFNNQAQQLLQHLNIFIYIICKKNKTKELSYQICMRNTISWMLRALSLSRSLRVCLFFASLSPRRVCVDIWIEKNKNQLCIVLLFTLMLRHSS